MMRAFAPKEILCPIDAGPASQSVLRWGNEIAKAFGAKIEILYADWLEAPHYFTQAQLASLQAESANQRATLESDLRELASELLGTGVSFTVSVVEGRPVDAILDRMRAQPPDLVVMGSHGRSGVARLLLGSVAENVVRSANCPVLIVRQTGSGEIDLSSRTVLCPVRFSKGAREAAEVARDLSAALGARLTLLHSIEPGSAEQQTGPDSFCEWIAPEFRRSCQVSEVTLHGDPAEQVILFAEHQKAALIVLSASHRAFLDVSTLGRTTVRVMRHSPIPVLLVPHHAGGADRATAAGHISAPQTARS